MKKYISPLPRFYTDYRTWNCGNIGIHSFAPSLEKGVVSFFVPYSGNTIVKFCLIMLFSTASYYKTVWNKHKYHPPDCRSKY